MPAAFNYPLLLAASLTCSMIFSSPPPHSTSICFFSVESLLYSHPTTNRVFSSFLPPFLPQRIYLLRGESLLRRPVNLFPPSSSCYLFSRTGPEIVCPCCCCCCCYCRFPSTFLNKGEPAIAIVHCLVRFLFSPRHMVFIRLIYIYK